MNFRPLFRILAILYFPLVGLAQNVEIKGIVQDTATLPQEGASVVLLNAKDSLLEKFAITEADGSFSIKRVSNGAYILQISFLGYQTYDQPLNLTEDMDLGSITLEPISQDIDALTVEAERIPIEIDGDTIKYNADAFKTRPNANVEELLKKLPGVEVGRDGAIRAQGEEVSKILVDGKEFFGNDPQIATQNLPADIVDQVQVFDEQSETSRFTGVDDGEREKTINLALKEDKNKGWFGDLEAGYGSENRYKGKANVNRFNDKMQFSALGRLNNINEQGFTIQDYFDLMGGMSAMMSGGMMIDPAELGISFNGEDRRQGFLTTGSFGTNLNYDFTKKSQLSLNYFYNYFDKEEDRSLNRTSFLEEDNSFTTDESSFQESVNKNHRLNARFKQEIDSSQNVQLRLNMGLNDRLADRQSFQETFLNNRQFQNSSDQQNQASNDNFDWNANVLYRKRFAKPGRSLVTNFSFGQRIVNGLNLVEASNIFGSIANNINQEQTIENNQWNYEGRFTLTEPIGKGKYLALNYRRRNYEERLDKNFYDIVAGQLTRNDLLSNQFISDYVFDRGGLALQWNTKKSKLRLSMDAQQARLIGDFLSEFPNVDRRFTNWLPGLSWDYEFKTSKSLNIDYRTEIREPNIQQLQPVVDNSNPISIYVGNPNLKPAYVHNIRINNIWFDQFSFTSIFTGFNIQYTRNQITNARTINENLQQVINPINVDRNLLVNGQASFSTPLRFIKTNIDIRTNFNYNQGILFVNSVENDLDQLNGDLTIALSNRKQEVLAAEIGSTIGYTDSRYSVNNEFNQDFFNQAYYLDLRLNIKNKWVIKTDISHTVFPMVNFGAAQDFTLWQASISRVLDKNEKTSITFTAFDLLNQNIGINRSATANFVQNENIRSLGRYFLLSFKYRLKSFGK